MDCQILWNELSAPQWNERFLRITRAPITQSVPYAMAAAKLYGQRPKWGVIVIGGQEAGLVQMMEAGILWNAIHAVIIDRGPLWFDGFGAAGHISLFWQAINTQFPQRFMRKRRFIPEMMDGMAAQSVLQGAGLTHQAGSAYQTLWMNLRGSEDDLRAGLKKNWRGSLQKSERQSLSIDWSDDGGAGLEAFLQYYALDKAARGYSGASVKMMGHLGHAFATKSPTIEGRAINNVVIARVMQDGQPLAAALIFIHGNSATYQAGWCTDKGRDVCANHMVLWQAALRLKASGITDFDLGGVNDETAAGIKKFKEGLIGKNDNGIHQTLPGIFS